MSIPSLMQRGSRFLATMAATVICLGVPTADVHGQNSGAGASDNRPIVAVLYFSNGAIRNNDDYSPLSKGLAEMMITELTGNANIRVVERDRIEAVYKELDLGASDRVDKETAVKAGKILSAKHLLMPAFTIDPKGRMRMDIRAVNTETSESVWASKVSGKADDMLDLLVQLAGQVNSGLKLPRVQTGFQEGKAVGAKSKNQLKSMMLLSRALEQQDRKNRAEAIVLYKESIKENPSNERARVLLASLEKETR